MWRRWSGNADAGLVLPLPESPITVVTNAAQDLVEADDVASIPSAAVVKIRDNAEAEPVSLKRRGMGSATSGSLYRPGRSRKVRAVGDEAIVWVGSPTLEASFPGHAGQNPLAPLLHSTRSHLRLQFKDPISLPLGQFSSSDTYNPEYNSNPLADLITTTLFLHSQWFVQE